MEDVVVVILFLDERCVLVFLILVSYYLSV